MVRVIFFLSFIFLFQSGVYAHLDLVSSSQAREQVRSPELPWFPKLLGKSIFECKGQCPTSIGMIGFFEQDFGEDTYVEQCTGFLVAPDVVATNSHCIPPHVKEGRVTCGERLGIVFPQSQGEPHVVRLCKSMISFSDSVNGVMDLDDYALFKIDAVSILPLKVSHEGIADNMSVHVSKINPREDGVLGGQFETLDCKTAQNSVLNLYAINRYSRTALAIGCEARGGNSGSPVFNEKNEVVGLLQSRKVANYLRFLGQELARKNLLEIPETPPAHFVFSNWACIPFPYEDPLAQESCEYYRHRNLAFVFNQLVDPERELFQQIVENWQTTLPDFFEYINESTTGFASIYTATPYCIKKSFLNSHQNDEFELELPSFLRIVKEYKFDDSLRFHPTTYFQSEVINAKYSLSISGGQPLLQQFVFVNGVKEFRPAYLAICE